MNILAYPSISPTDTNPDELLHRLVFSHTTTLSTCLKVVWDLSQFANQVLSLLPESVRTELSSAPHRSRWGNYRLYYIPDKVFSVNKSGSEASFYDLSQYYPDAPEPQSLPELQEKADQLQQALIDLGVTDPKSLSSPVAAFKGHKLLGGIQDIIPTVFDAPASVLGAYETALQCTPREWVANYQVGHWGADDTGEEIL